MARKCVKNKLEFMLLRPGTRDTAFEEWSYLPHLYSLYEEQPAGCPSLLFLREVYSQQFKSELELAPHLG